MTTKSHKINHARRRKVASKTPKHPQLVGGKMSVKHLRTQVKSLGHKLSMNGKPLRKAELLAILHGRASGGRMSGGVNRLKKAHRWLGFAEKAGDSAINLFSKGMRAYKNI